MKYLKSSNSQKQRMVVAGEWGVGGSSGRGGEAVVEQLGSEA